MTLTPFYKNKMGRYIKRLERRRKEKTEELRKQLRDEAFRLGQLLAEAGFGIERIYLFGSVSKKNRPLFLWSDIDLAVEGLPKGMFYKVYAFLLKKSRFEIDLKPFDELSDAQKRKIEQEGEVVYERK